jgi:hypothetical protein
VPVLLQKHAFQYPWTGAAAQGCRWAKSKMNIFDFYIKKDPLIFGEVLFITSLK